jgi:hypothetical protein
VQAHSPPEHWTAQHGTQSQGEDGQRQQGFGMAFYQTMVRFGNNVFMFCRAAVLNVGRRNQVKYN